MNRFRIILRDCPCDVDGYIVEGMDDNGDVFYTICINSRMNAERQRETFYHEMIHIEHGDFERAEVDPVSEVEKCARGA